MASFGDDSESSIKNQKTVAKCRICYRECRSVIKCVLWNETVHRQCLQKIAEIIKIDVNNWYCKTCSILQPCGDKCDSVKIKSDLKHLQEKYDLVTKLNEELTTVNNLL